MSQWVRVCPTHYEKNANRNYKEGIFRALFDGEEKLRILYNALSGSSYPEGTHVEIEALENSIFGDIANDLAFIIDNRLIILIDHQFSETRTGPCACCATSPKNTRDI